MKKRCLEINNKDYHHYGGRGITVCDRWVRSYENFLEDMGRKPTPQHTLDRIDNSGNYEPSNCKWSTREEQANNKRTNRNIIIYGITYSVARAARIFEINEHYLRHRLNNGMEAHAAIFTT